jgi:voltage-gated potassium channel
MAPGVMPTELRGLFSHTTAVLFLLTAGYYAVPFRLPTQAEGYARLIGSMLALGLLALLLRQQVRRSRRSLSPSMHRVLWLLTALYVLVLGFALIYAVVADLGKGQIDGINNRTDALYFSVTVMSTVGFGDIHAAGSLARLIVTVHMVFNLIYLGTALRWLTWHQPADE